MSINIYNEQMLILQVCYSVSAGVGRTGTLLALDYLLDQADAEGMVDIYTCVKQLRERRINMVQTLVRYMYIS
jgi:protein tyrosine phosphatase